MCENCKSPPLSNKELLDIISTFLTQKQESTNKVFNDYFKACARIAELEAENKMLKEQIEKGK